MLDMLRQNKLHIPVQYYYVKYLLTIEITLTGIIQIRLHSIFAFLDLLIV